MVTATEETGKKRRNGKKNVVDAIKASLCPLDTSQSDPMRVAVLLDWAAKEHPYEFIPYNFLLKAIRGFKQTPMVGSKDVERVRGRISPAKVILMRDFGRTVISLTGGGVRATVDDMDTAKNALPGQMSRVRAASASLVRTRNLVDIRALPRGPEGDQVRRWVTKNVDEVMKVVGAEGFMDKLLVAPSLPDNDPKE